MARIAQAAGGSVPDSAAHACLATWAAALAAAGSQSTALGVVLGAAGGIAGSFLGYTLRTRLVRALKVPDFVIAALGDVVAIGGMRVRFRPVPHFIPTNAVEIVKAIVKHSKGDDLPAELLIPTSLYRQADAMKDPELK